MGDPCGFLYASPDTGVTWNLVLDKGNGLIGVQDIDFNNANRGIVISCSLIAFTYYHPQVWSSQDGGATWEVQWAGNGQLFSKICFLNKNNGWAVGESGLVLNTNTGGVTEINETSSSILPHTVWLHPNYPNPFNSETRIVFTLTESLPVRLDVLDIQGRTVAVLVNQPLLAGQHSYRWKAARSGVELPTGVYLVRLQVGKYPQIRKILYLK